MELSQESNVPPLERQDLLHLRAAEGWFGLGDYAEANRELDQIRAELRTHPDVLELRWEIYAKGPKWKACLDIAEAIIKLDPNRPDAWIQRSFTLHELQRTQEAFDMLLPAAGKFSGLWTIPYNLACYCAQLGKLNESQEWFKKAMAIDEQKVKALAIDDPDLKPLWDSMSGTLWKRSE